MKNELRQMFASGVRARKKLGDKNVVFIPRVKNKLLFLTLIKKVCSKKSELK